MSYNFTIALKPFTKSLDEVEDALFEAGCDDALLYYQGDLWELEFNREGTSLTSAIQSAIVDINNAAVPYEKSYEVMNDWKMKQLEFYLNEQHKTTMIFREFSPKLEKVYDKGETAYRVQFTHKMESEMNNVEMNNRTMSFKEAMPFYLGALVLTFLSLFTSTAVLPVAAVTTYLFAMAYTLSEWFKNRVIRRA